MTILVLALLLQITGTPQAAPPASISGTVVDSRSATPIANAELALNQIAGPTHLRVRTDAAGAFALPDIPSGRYYLLATHPDYLDQAYPGLPDSSMRGAVGEFTLATGEQRKAPIRMLRGATISGRVYDSNRAPLANAGVSPRVLVPQVLGPAILGSIQPYEGVGDGSRLFVKTNERGEYRMTGIPPGEYYIGAATSGPTSFYPGFRNPDRSIPLKIAASADVTGIDVTLEPASDLRISGRIVNSLLEEGRPFGYRYMLIPRDARVVEEAGSATSTLPDSNEAPDEFELLNVAPGSYDLYIAYSARPKIIPARQVISQVGRLAVDVKDRDVTGLTVTIMPGLEIPGRFVLDESARALQLKLPDVGFFLQPADTLPRTYAPQANSFFGTGVAEDGTFTLTNAPPGRYLLTVILPFRQNVYLSGARLGTRDILSQPFEIDGNNKESFVFELSGQAGRAEGVVTDRDSKPVAHAQVVFVPPLERRRENPAYKIVETDANGHFEVLALSPGVYTAYAFTQIQVGKWTESQYMSQFAAQGVSVNVERNARIQRDLKLIP